VYTSNVDTAFQRAGINSELIYEIHGDVMKWQCRIPCCQKVWTLPDEYRSFRVGGGEASDRASGLKWTKEHVELDVLEG